MTIQAITALMNEHHLLGYTRNGAGEASVKKTNKGWVLTLGGLPQLPFYIALADLLNVKLEKITTEADDYSDGCETCGYGAGTEYIVTVPRALEVK
jgi:hypothetical protein